MVKIIQLNIEKNRHDHLSIPFFKAQNADIICLQEVLQHQVSILETETGMYGTYAPISFQKGLNDFQGNLILTKHKVIDAEIFQYHKSPMADTSYNVLRCDIKINDIVYRICTTHFPVTPDGETNDEQQQAWIKFKPFLESQENFILTGDMNSPRGREMFSKMAEFMTDNLPENIITTLDPKHHRKPELVLAVDTIFSKEMYRVSDVKVHDNLSDHMAIVATITKL